MTSRQIQLLLHVEQQTKRKGTWYTHRSPSEQTLLATLDRLGFLESRKNKTTDVREYRALKDRIANARSLGILEQP